MLFLRRVLRHESVQNPQFLEIKSFVFLTFVFGTIPTPNQFRSLTKTRTKNNTENATITITDDNTKAV